jgi:hypothetical protein
MSDVASVDLDVTKARQICKDVTCPEASSLYALVRFARWTESVPELVLFIRYQAARTTTRDNLRPFYNNVADVVESHDILRARRFLGFVVRAAAVERRAAAGRRDKERTQGVRQP